MPSRNHAVIDNGISITVLPRNRLPVYCCSYCNWSMPECIFRTVMVRPFLKNTLLSSNASLGINYYLWSNTNLNTKCIPWRVFQLFFCLGTVPVLLISHVVIFHVRPTWMRSGTRKPTLPCNPIQKHTIYSPWGNCIYKALTFLIIISL